MTRQQTASSSAARAGALALAIGLAITAASFAFVRTDRQRRERQSVERPANEALLSAQALLSGVDQVLSTANGVAASTGNEPQRFAAVLGPDVAARSTITGLTFVVARTGEVVTVGTPTLFNTLRASVATVGPSSTLLGSRANAAGYVVGFAQQVAHGIGAVYVEVQLTLSGEPAGTYAFVSADPRAAQRVVLGNARSLDGLSASAGTVTLDGMQLVLYVRKDAGPISLAGIPLEWLVLIFGTALSGLAAASAAIDARRRRAVAHLSSENAALDAALARQREVEHDLRAWQARFRAMLIDSPDYVLLMDLVEDTCESLNRREFLGHPVEECEAPGGLLALVHDEDHDEAVAFWSRIHELEPDQVGEMTLRMRDAADAVRFARVRFSPLNATDGRQRVLLGQISDVTDEWSNQLRETELREALRRSQRFDAVGQLAGGVAHDFNNVLAAVLASAELLEDDVPDHAREYTTEIQRAVQRGAGLVRQLLTFAQRDAAAPETIDLNDIVRDMEPLLRRTIGEHVHLQVTTVADPCFVRADPTHLEQVVLNLAVNARDAMPDGGILWIATAIDASGDDGDDRVMLSVTDTGTGISPDVRDRMFEPFVTTKEPGQGTGLGLATVMSIVRELDGELTVMSEPNQGTTFEISLARTTGEPTPGANTPTRTWIDGRGRAVLLVEDDGSVRSSLAHTLERHRFAVTTATNATDALRMLERQSFDLVVSDTVMPGMSGLELIEQIATLYPSTRVVLMSGYSNQLLDTTPHPSIMRLRKPFTSAELLEAVAHAIELVAEPLP